ncbi:MAG: hypothetical protein H6734_28130 [Alphaproteobacteria bacterium]|nr:hypothetical protein [Alphaproteobacteria bacterium]
MTVSRLMVIVCFHSFACSKPLLVDGCPNPNLSSVHYVVSGADVSECAVSDFVCGQDEVYMSSEYATAEQCGCGCLGPAYVRRFEQRSHGDDWDAM